MSDTSSRPVYISMNGISSAGMTLVVVELV